MTIFVDPLGQYTFEMPPEWAYDAVKSHLITVFFSRWDRHEETLFVRALPALAPDADDDEWCSEAAAQMFPKDAAPIRRRCGEGVALFAEVESDGDSPAHTSALLVRGARLDALAQHYAPGRSKDTGIAEPLTTICRTLQVPTNAFAPQMIGRAKIDGHLMAAQVASVKDDWDETLSQASRAMPHARSAYLSGIASGAMLPNVPAAVAVIGSLIFRGQAQPDLLALRDAERLIARAARTARELPWLRASSRRAVLNDLHGQLEMVNSKQRAIIEPILEDGTPGDAPLPLVVVNALVSLGCKAYERRNYDASLQVAEAAAEELLSLLAAAQAAGGAAAVLGPALKARVQEAGVLSDEEKLALSRRLGRRDVMSFMPQALGVLSKAQACAGEMTRARRTAEMLVEVARELDSPEKTEAGAILPPEGHRKRLAYALINLAESYIAHDEAFDIGHVQRPLDEAARALGGVSDSGPLLIKHRLLSAAATRYPTARRPEKPAGEALLREVITSRVSLETLQTLATWALGGPSPLPWEPEKEVKIPQQVVREGAGAIIRYGLEQYPTSDASDFWRVSSPGVPRDAEVEAMNIIGKWLESLNWRHGWAIAALRALDFSPPLDDPGLLRSIELVRANLVHPSTIVNCRLGRTESQSQPPADDSLFSEPPTLEESPFGDPVVREVLLALDLAIAAQECRPSRMEEVLYNMEWSVVKELHQARDALDEHHGQLLNQSVFEGGTGSAIGTILRADSEKAEGAQNYNRVGELNNVLIHCTARYGHTRDFLLAVARAASTTARINPSVSNLAMMAQILEHIKIAVTWLGDSSAEASIQHELALVLRGGARKVPGLLDAIAAFQRAITLREQSGDTVAAIGSQIDLSSVLIQGNNMFSWLDEAPDEAREWDRFAEIYLSDAIERLAGLGDDPRVLTYIGEAYHNRAKLFQVTGKNPQAADDALRSLNIAVGLGNKDMEARAYLVLAQASDDPQERIKNLKSTSELMQDIRYGISSEHSAVTWVVNKDGVFDIQLSSLLHEAGRSIEEERACELIVEALETSRGHTYNRWLGASPVTRVEEVMEELARDTANPVVALYVSTSSQVALVVVERGQPPRLFRINMTNREVEDMVAAHFSGLKRQGKARVPGLWNASQRQFLADGHRLVAPLEPYIQEGRTICIVPHRALHGAGLHTLPTSPGGQPIGLRTPVYQNPSLTNLMVARRAASAPAQDAYAGITSPQNELSKFSDARMAAQLLADAGLKAVHPEPASVDLESLGTGGARWRVLHLSSHGIFEAPRPEMGLLLSYKGELPPTPFAQIDDSFRNHLASPDELRKAGATGRLTFLASCLSSRNEEYPGDDLMGVTRAFFASGTADMIAGAWAVLSSMTGIFAETFYRVLLDGSTTAQAVLEARRAVAQKFPDPFYWGVYVHQGANASLW